MTVPAFPNESIAHLRPRESSQIFGFGGQHSLPGSLQLRGSENICLKLVIGHHIDSSRLKRTGKRGQMGEPTGER